MKRNSLLLATALLIGMTGCKNTPVQKEAWISNALDAASYQLKSTAEELSGTSKFPRSIHSGYDVNYSAAAREQSIHRLFTPQSRSPAIRTKTSLRHCRLDQRILPRKPLVCL